MFTQLPPAARRLCPVCLTVSLIVSTISIYVPFAAILLHSTPAQARWNSDDAAQLLPFPQHRLHIRLLRF